MVTEAGYLAASICLGIGICIGIPLLFLAFSDFHSFQHISFKRRVKETPDSYSNWEEYFL